MKHICIIVVLFLFAFTAAQAQSRKSKEHPATSKGDDYSRMYDYRTNKANKKLHKRKSRKSGILVYYDQKVEEFKDRMEEAAKRYKKMEKEMKKPQYSDPTYFGHKHKPKKRPPGKKKFCKVCGIWH